MPIGGGPCAFMIFATIRSVCNTFGACAAVSESVQQLFIAFGECASIWSVCSQVDVFAVNLEILCSEMESVQ